MKKADSTPISVEKIKSIEKTEGAYGPQGFEVTDKYFVIAEIILDGEGTIENPILIYDKNTLEYVKTIHHNIGHGNDICYNSDTHELLFIYTQDSQVTLVVYDSDTLTFKKNIQLDNSLFSNSQSITYNNKEKEYIINNGTEGYILNQNFEFKRKFDLRIRQIAQSLEYADDYIYFTAYSYINTEVSYQVEFENYYGVIYVFDKNGKYVNTVYIPRIENNIVEIEGTAIDEKGQAYFLYNNYTTQRIEIYKAKYNSKNKANIEIPIKIDNKDLTINGYYYNENNKNDIHNITSNNNLFKINFDINSLGTTNYLVYQKKSDSNVILDNKPIKVVVNTKYNLSKNKVDTEIKLSRNGFSNRIKKISIDSSPKTGKNKTIIYYLIVLLLTSTISYMKINKRQENMDK